MPINGCTNDSPNSQLPQSYRQDQTDGREAVSAQERAGAAERGP